ncbi:uncharacterized protein LOC117641171 isoform X1 [Thrips palmi]|uniref:Uncharacterized protein LOC117641171 isoform X1 n=1 Tax=Thrips palmi TaxID=161013 RepID=A0A6P8YJT9_THRPL|nr:uncharacterized protein LOC117641171 isoform X1 [Thrips palmi]
MYDCYGNSPPRPRSRPRRPGGHGDGHAVRPRAAVGALPLRRGATAGRGRGQRRERREAVRVPRLPRGRHHPRQAGRLAPRRLREQGRQGAQEGLLRGDVTVSEVLVGGRVSWVRGSNGQVPANALVAGRTVQGENLYVGRFRHAGTMTPGKVHVSHRCCYIPYGGNEVSATSYEVLVA